MSGFGKLFEASKESGAKAKVGRPATGKRSNPEYERYSVFVQIETAKRVKRFIFDRVERGEEEGDFSDAVDEALKFWLEHGRPSGK